MNDLYLVVSEELSEVIPILDDGSGPLEYYKIVVLVSTSSRGKAKWLAWQTDKSFDYDIRDMPKFWVRKIGKTRRASGTIIDGFDRDPLWKRVPNSVWQSLPE